MDAIDVLVLRTVRDWRAAGRRSVLATVVRTWGSSPRPVGAMMALRDDGQVVGSVSGGCIEDDLIHRYTSSDVVEPLQTGPCTLVRYGVSADEAHRFGLPCGGTLELLLERDPDPALLTEVVTRLDAGHLVRRQVDCTSGRVTLSVAPQPAEVDFDGTMLTCTLGPGYRMLLIGAGALAHYLATMAQFNGFKVTVCDPRVEHRAGWALPDVTLVTDMPDDVVTAFRPDARSCVIALAHDPKLDDLALLEALDSPAFYVGAIGSRRNHASRRARFITHLGQTPESLARLRGPIGLYIGSKTPAEIAVSIMAEVLAVKNGLTLAPEMTVADGKGRRERAGADH